jgi:adenylate kinase family enzyme
VPSPERIAVIGPVASGKSTLARYLGSRLGLPVVELDDIYWGEDRAFSDDEWPTVHRRLLEPERWIIAGDYRAVAGERFAAADMVVWLDLPRPVCWWRACLRRNSVSKIACIRWIWRYPAHGRRQTIASLHEHARDKIVVQLRSMREVEDFMTGVDLTGREPSAPGRARA